MTLDNPKQKLETKQEQVSTQPDPKNQVVEDLDKRSEQTLYTKRITRIEGGNLRGGAPGRVNGQRTVESTEKAVKTIHEKFHPNTVISFENTLDDSASAEVLAVEKKAWTGLGVKFIELPVKETELSKLFEDNLRQTTLEAFGALDNGGTFVHCTHGLQRARAFTEIWRATRGIDRRKAIQENPNFKSGDHKKCGENAQEIIEKILKNPLEARAELSKEVTPTPENLADEFLAPKIALIGDSIGEGISKTIANKFPGHEARAVSSARLEKSAEPTAKNYHKSVSTQLEEIDSKVTPYLVIQGGTNDIGHTNDPVTIAESLKNLYEKAKSKGFKKVIVVTLTPHTNPKYATAVNSINAQLRIFASQGKIELYDLNREYSKIDPQAENLTKGGVHPTNKGYKILAELLLKGVKEKLSEESKEKLAETVGTALAEQEPEAIQPSQSTEHLSEKSKELQGKLAKEIEAITEEQRKLDEQKLSQAEIKDIRFNTALLNGNEDKVKEEMTHRLAQYTEKQADGGLRLNYVKFNASGHDHEMNIGLGDIMPPEYKRIVVVTSGGEVRMGKRGIVSTSRESNRIGYIDESTGGYLATFTGDTIYVLDPPLTDEKELAELLAKEKEARKNGSQTYTEYTGYSGSTSENGSHEKAHEFTENKNLKDEVATTLNKNIGNKKFWNYDNLEIKDNSGNILWKYNQSLGEGENIYSFSVAVCKHLGMEDMINVVWGIVGAESTFNPFDKNKKSQATGLGQPMHSTWESFIKYAKRGRDPFIRSILDGQYGVGVEYPDSKGQNQVNLNEHRFPPEKDYLNYSRCNPFLNIYHTIAYTKTSIDRYQQSLGIDIRQFDTRKTLRYLYLMHHDGHYGGVSMIKFLNKMESLGINTENREEVSRFIKSGTREADETLSLLAGEKNGEGSSQENRARTDTDHFLNTWYKTGFTAANYAMKGQTQRQETQQPPQSTELAAGLTPKQKAIAESISSTPKSNFDPDAVYVLGFGGGKDPKKSFERNHERMVAGAALAIKYNAAFLTSGGPTPKYRAKGTTEGQEGYDYVTNNPYFRQRFIDQGIQTGIENKSGSTVGNIRNAIGFFKKQGYKRILIVTDDTSHARRAIHNKEGTGLKDLAPNIEVSFYTPENPDIDRNVA